MAGTFEGRCECGRVGYRLTDVPLFVNCCHCLDCQRLTGSAFALNGMIETGKVELSGAWTEDDVLTTSGGRSWRCAACGVLLFADHRLFGDAMRFVRLGTLADALVFPPDAHFFVRSKHPWITLPPGVPAHETLPEDGLGAPLPPERAQRLAAAMPA